MKIILNVAANIAAAIKIKIVIFIIPSFDSIPVSLEIYKSDGIFKREGGSTITFVNGITEPRETKSAKLLKIISNIKIKV